MNNPDPIEGYFIVTSDNLIFEVKGVIHPDDRKIAYVRYVPICKDSPRIRENIHYMKIYNLLEREKFLRENYPKYFWYDSRNDRVLQSVKFEDFKEVLNPVKAVCLMNDDDYQVCPVANAAKKLVNLLVSKSGASPRAFGITGSILAGLATPESDIDLVVYGEVNARKVFEVLQNDIELQSQIKRYEGLALDEITRFRWGDCHNWTRLREIEKRKVLQGIFQSYPFYIRLVKYPHEVGVQYYDITYKMLGRGHFLCKIIDDNDSIFTPCTYRVSCENDKRIKQIVSYRGRFTEQAKCGMIVRVEGTLEIVHDHRSEDKFCQVVLGSNPCDLMMPQ